MHLRTEAEINLLSQGNPRPGFKGLHLFKALPELLVQQNLQLCKKHVLFRCSPQQGLPVGPLEYRRVLLRKEHNCISALLN